MITEIVNKLVTWKEKDHDETLRQQLIIKWTEKQSDALSYQEYLAASKQLDMLLGNDKWKNKKESKLYYYQIVENRLEQLQQARKSGDVDTLMHLLRTTLQRNLGNMGDEKLYSNCNTGTKKLIEDYINECEKCFEMLLNTDKVDCSTLLSSLIQSRKAFGRTALVLSGGSTFGILHIGVIKELYDQNLLPRIVSGSSAGSIFASLLCIHKDEEMDDLLKLPSFNDFDIFEQTGKEETTMERLARFLKYGTWFDNRYLSNTMRHLLGDLTFQEAYYRTRRVLNVTVSSASVHEMPRLLNYLTAPNVLIWSAVCASCSVPLVFASYDIRAKNPKTGQHYSWSPSTFIDGSVDNDLPLSRLSEMFNVNHFIACQVNPHIVPFLHLNQKIASFDERKQDENENDETYWRDIWNSAQTILRNEISHYLLMLSEVGLFKNTSSKLRSVLAQQYSGDITILPQILLSELQQMFKNPTKDFFAHGRLRAARATWPKISVIRNHLAIELELDRSIHQLKTRLLPDTMPLAITLSHPSSSPSKNTSLYNNNVIPLIRKHSSSLSQKHQRRRSESQAVRYLKRNYSWQDNNRALHDKHVSMNSNCSFVNSVPPTRRNSVSSKHIQPHG